jgi:hypothetical protein
MSCLARTWPNVARCRRCHFLSAARAAAKPTGLAADHDCRLLDIHSLRGDSSPAAGRDGDRHRRAGVSLLIT